MLNHIVIMGRLTRDPELRYTQSQTPVASFSLAVDRDFGGRDGGEKQTDFIDCVAWRQTAEFVNKYFTKGSMVAVSGRLQMRDWTDRDGNKRTSAEVVADNVYFGDSKRDGGKRRSAEVVVDNMYFGESKRRDGGDSRSDSYSNSYSRPSSGYDAPRSVNSAPSAFSELDDGDGELPF